MLHSTLSTVAGLSVASLRVCEYGRCLIKCQRAHMYEILQIGQAVRLSLASGMHTNMPIDHLGAEALQRRRRIWWTVYILDRQMTSLMGLPQSIEDNQIYHKLPLFPDSPHKVTALSMQIKMCQIIAEVNRSRHPSFEQL